MDFWVMICLSSNVLGWGYILFVYHSTVVLFYVCTQYHNVWFRIGEISIWIWESGGLQNIIEGFSEAASVVPVWTDDSIQKKKIMCYILSEMYKRGDNWLKVLWIDKCVTPEMVVVWQIPVVALMWEHSWNSQKSQPIRCACRQTSNRLWRGGCHTNARAFQQRWGYSNNRH